jgi:hypothetical protein
MIRVFLQLRKELAAVDQNELRQARASRKYDISDMGLEIPCCSPTVTRKAGM